MLAYRMPAREKAMNSTFGEAAAVRLCMLCVALCAAGMAQAEGTAIYRSYDATGKVPTFSDRPINRTSHVFAEFDGHRLWPRAGTGPVTLAQLAARRKELEPLVQRIATLHGVHAALLNAVIEVESGFN